MRASRVGLAASLVAAFLLTACGSDNPPSAGGDGSGAGEPYTVRFGSVGGLTDAGLYIAEERGYFEEQNLTVGFNRMGGGSELTTALATGNLDVAGISVTAALFNAVSDGIGLKIVGDKQSIRPGVSATHLVVQSALVGDDLADTVENLRGKIVAISDKTSSAAAVLGWILEDNGMSLDDVDLRTLAYPEITASLINESVDAAIELEPFLSQALASGHVESVSDSSEVLPETGASTVPIVYSSEFAEKNEDAAQRFMVAYMKGVRDYNDAMFKDEGKDEVIAIIAEGSGQTEDVVRSAQPWGLDPNQEVSVDFLNELQAWFVEQGHIRSEVDPAEMVDDSFAAFAVDELGEYGAS
jgi:NitT/TauT family transport system substrate-binding protein